MHSTESRETKRDGLYHDEHVCEWEVLNVYVCLSVVFGTQYTTIWEGVATMYVKNLLEKRIDLSH